MNRQAKMLLILAGLLILGSQAFADPFNPNDAVTVSWLSLTASAGSYGYGAQFTITDNVTGASIQTFCIEITEHLDVPLKVGSIDAYAINGGLGGGPQDYISNATKWLYADFLSNPSQYTNPGALQIAFWALEDEFPQTSTWQAFYGPNNGALITAAEGYIAAAQTAVSGGFADNGVRVLNLQNGSTPEQSFLIKVPEPGIALLLAIGMFGVGLISKKLN
jgi:hypothetical protein